MKVFKILLSGRHYKRVNEADISNFGVRIEISTEELIETLNTKLDDFGNLGTYFKIEEIGDYSFVKQHTNYPIINILDSKGTPELNAKGKQKERPVNILTLASKKLGDQFYQR